MAQGINQDTASKKSKRSPDSTLVYCNSTCCRSGAIMAVRYPDRVEIVAKHHGREHKLTLYNENRKNDDEKGEG